MNLPEVPESVSRETVTEFFKSVGIDPWLCAGVRLDPSGIYAEMFALDDRGVKIITREGPAMSDIFIPFV